MKITTKTIFLLTFSIAFSCGTNRIENLSDLTIENKKSNSLIENRKPDYGISGKDGCVIMSEISMNIMEFKNDYLKGKLFDSETNDPISYSNIRLHIKKEGKLDTLTLQSDSNGFFEKEFNGKLTKIDVSYIGYRDLIIDLKKV